MKLILIRHGMTLANEKRLYCGSTDLGLSEAGRAQLIRQKGEVNYPDIDGMRVLTSGKKRCEETLSIIYGDIDHACDVRLAEMDFGIFEMHSYDELKEWPEYMEWITGDNESNPVPSGESGVIMTKRVLDALDELLAEGRDTAIVTHGGVISAIMAYLFPAENKNRYEWQCAPGRGYVIEICGETRSYFAFRSRPA
ncbi:MAG: histidine phosphatase family protein [Clostridia bacterium]|nr:histidine phosphatase family protein [Clostridia bacterium]